jgi:hypothetical protein
MSLDKSYGKYTVVCNICGVSETLDSFDEMVEYKKDFGWKSKKIKNEWVDYCPDCKYD